MKFLLRNTLILSFAVLLFACNKTADGEISWQPNSLNLEPPPGPPEYQEGWTQGCESGANAYSNSFYKTVGAFDFKFDPTKRNNKMYYQAWKDAFIYCSIYWERTNQENI